MPEPANTSAVPSSSSLLLAIKQQGIEGILSSLTKATGEGIRVGMIDTGVERKVLEARHGESVVLSGGKFAPNQDRPLPYDGTAGAPHGTTVADVLLKHAPCISLYSADVFSFTGQCTIDTLLSALQWCITQESCRVINLSLGITEQQLLPIQRRGQLQRLMEECYHRNIIVVAAAHNDHPHTRSYPASFSVPLISVSKSKQDLTSLALYSPLEQIEFQANSKGYWGPFADVASSSWATPHISATIARLLSLFPNSTPFEVKTLLTWLS